MEDEKTPSGPGMLDFGKSMGQKQEIASRVTESLQTDVEKTLPGQGGLDFSNSPGMEQAKAAREAQEEKERAVREGFQREMDNIKEHGPLDRGTERVLSEEEREAVDLLEKGDYYSVKQAVRSQLEAIGGDEEDFQTLDYFERFIGDPNPEVRNILTQMSLLTVRLMKLRGKNR